jgi:hypothetical protein
MRMLRAVPQLADVRLGSHRELAQALTRVALNQDPSQDRALLECQARLVVDLGFAAIELVLDEPDLDEALVMAQAARAIRVLLGLADQKLTQGFSVAPETLPGL